MNYTLIFTTPEINELLQLIFIATKHPETKIDVTKAAIKANDSIMQQKMAQEAKAAIPKAPKTEPEAAQTANG